MKPLFKKIAIVGVGLIGGSLGMAIKKNRIAKSVIGVLRREATMEKAFQKKALDTAVMDLKSGVKDADLIILCAPVSTIIRHIRDLSSLVQRGALIIDVGSSKGEISRAAKKYLKRGSFVGCHPMAGSEKSGVEFAHEALFKNSVCFMTSHHPKIENFWKALGARTIFIDTKRHDEWVTESSHLPHLISFALFQGVASRKKIPANPSIQELARLSRSHPGLWADILLSNRVNILPRLSSFKKSLNFWSVALQKKNRSQIIRAIEQANKNSSHAIA